MLRKSEKIRCWETAHKVFLCLSGEITCSSPVCFKFLMFSNDTLLYLERTSTAQILRFLVHAGLSGLKNQSKQVTGETLVSTLHPKCFDLGLMSAGPKCLSNLWWLERSRHRFCSSKRLILFQPIFFFQSSCSLSQFISTFPTV